MQLKHLVGCRHDWKPVTWQEGFHSALFLVFICQKKRQRLESNETQQLKSTPATSSTDPTFSWVSRPPDLCTNPDGTICGMLQPKEGHHGIDLQLVYGSNGKEKYLEAKVIKNKCHGHISSSLIKLEWAHLGCKESSSKWILSLTYTHLQLVLNIYNMYIYIWVFP